MRKKVAQLIEGNAILQAPMAGITTPELVSEVSNQGGIGNIGAGYLKIPELNQFIDEVNESTNAIYGINLFVPEKTSMSLKELEDTKEAFKEFIPKYSKSIPKEIKNENVFNEQIALIISKHVPIVSFTFGLPNKEIIKRLKRAEIYVIGTATTVEEAIAVERSGCDAVVAQGSEAGGHRGTFLGEDYLIGLMSLVPQIADHVNIPIIAAGGIMDSRGVKAAFCLGASSVQLGSAFLMTEESSAHALHKNALLNSIETDTLLTKAFSGKLARGIKNEFTQLYVKQNVSLLAYPYQNSLTKNMRKQAAKNNDSDYMSLWAGQSVRLCKKTSVRELLKELKR